MGSIVVNPLPLRHRRGRAAFALLCGLFLWLAGCGPALAQVGRWYPENVAPPPLVLKDIDGKEYDLAAFKGRIVIVNFWATWCGPCVAEMPSLQALASRLGERNALVLGVNYHESPQKIRDFQAKYRLNFPLLRDAWQEASAAWKVNVLPTTFIVDAAGVLRYRVVGEVDWSSRQVADRLKQIQTPTAGSGGTTRAMLERPVAAQSAQ
jgi:thiol-disulfide isomerase/thioredoxin